MRKKFLVNPGLQIRHLVWTLCVVLISCMVGYVLFESMIATALQNVGVLGSDLRQVLTLTRWGFFLIMVILLSAIGVENYLLFHKFVGPLHALEKGLNKISKGDFSSPIHIRESDQLESLIKEFENMRKEIKKVMEKEAA
jgi:nitrogen fixation/metabolism regulation signal transduction histidine kinase